MASFTLFQTMDTEIWERNASWVSQSVRNLIMIYTPAKLDWEEISYD